MARNRHRTPNPQPVADALDRMTTALAALAPAQNVLPLVSPELVPCRLLNGGHIGRVIEVPGRPSSKQESLEPSVLTRVGVLVGIGLGNQGRNGLPPERALVVARGNEQGTIFLRVDAPVTVYPKASK